jgi:hypothetical protein
MDADDAKKALYPSFHSLFTNGFKRASTDYAGQIRALKQITRGEFTDQSAPSEDDFYFNKSGELVRRPDSHRGLIRAYVNPRISELSEKLIAVAPTNRQARMAVIDLDLATPREVYADVVSFYHDAVTQNDTSLSEIPVAERLAALKESHEFLQKSPDQDELVKLHTVHGTLAGNAQSAEEALPHWQAVVDIHPTTETRNALINSLLVVAHKKPAQRTELCREAQHNLAILTPKVLNPRNPNFRFHTLLSAELCNLNGDYDQTLKLMHPLRKDPCALMYAAAAYLFKKNYSEGLHAVASLCSSTLPPQELLDVYERSRCREAITPLLRKNVMAHVADTDSLDPKNKTIIAQFGDKITKAERSLQA